MSLKRTPVAAGEDRSHGRRKRGDGGGDTSLCRELIGDVPLPEQKIFQDLFSWRVLRFCIFEHFQNNKVAEIRGETKFWGRWV